MTMHEVLERLRFRLLVSPLEVERGREISKSLADVLEIMVDGYDLLVHRNGDRLHCQLEHDEEVREASVESDAEAYDFIHCAVREREPDNLRLHQLAVKTIIDCYRSGKPDSVRALLKDSSIDEEHYETIFHLVHAAASIGEDILLREMFDHEYPDNHPEYYEPDFQCH